MTCIAIHLLQFILHKFTKITKILQFTIAIKMHLDPHISTFYQQGGCFKHNSPQFRKDLKLKQSIKETCAQSTFSFVFPFTRALWLDLTDNISIFGKNSLYRFGNTKINYQRHINDSIAFFFHFVFLLIYTSQPLYTEYCWLNWSHSDNVACFGFEVPSVTLILKFTGKIPKMGLESSIYIFLTVNCNDLWFTFLMQLHLSCANGYI